MNKFADNTDMYVGTLTADEIVYAGGKVNTNNLDYYLINDYQKSNGLNLWSLSPFSFSGNYDFAFRLSYYGDLGFNSVDSDISFRPAVSLKSFTTIQSGGDGTQSNPYIVE